MHKRLMLAAIAFMLTAESPAKREARLVSATPAMFNVAITDDALETAAEFTTGNSRSKSVSIGGFLGTDITPWLSGSINKQTGERFYMLMVRASYVGDWRFLDSGNYQTAGVTKSVQAVIGQRDVTGCVNVACSHVETIGVPLSDADARAIASSSGLWNFGSRAVAARNMIAF